MIGGKTNGRTGGRTGGTRRRRGLRWGLVGLGVGLLAAPVQARVGWEDVGDRLGAALEAELGLARQAVDLERAVATLEREQEGAGYGAAVLDHAGRESMRRLDAYRTGREARETLARQRARVMYKIARGGIARIVLDHADHAGHPDHATHPDHASHADHAAGDEAGRSFERDGAEGGRDERVARGRDLRWLVRNDLRELSAYQRAEQRARDELLQAERQLQALSVLATVHDVQGELVSAARGATGTALARARQQRDALLNAAPPEARAQQAHRERLAELQTSLGTLAELQREGGRAELVRPVHGREVGRFGSYTDPILRLPMVRNGVELAAHLDEPVLAPAAGLVVMVAELPGFDQVVVLDHGGGELTMLGRLWKATVSEGDRVEAGEELARVAPKSIDDGLGTSVYLELRHGDKPVDPGPRLGRRRR